MTTKTTEDGIFEGFMSNFEPSEVIMDEAVFPTVEHGFQAAKTFEVRERQAICDAETPGKAKRLGREATLRPDWNDVKVGVMRDLLRQKFANEGFRSQLELTGDEKLVEWNSWHDNVWGVCTCAHCPGEGENWLGRLLMEIRDDT